MKTKNSIGRAICRNDEEIKRLRRVILYEIVVDYLRRVAKMTQISNRLSPIRVALDVITNLLLIF